MSETVEASGGRAKRSKGALRFFIGIVVLLLVGGVLVAIKTEAIRVFLVVSDSMEPTLLIGDRILVDSQAYPERYSIVTFPDPENPYGPPLVKRIIGLGGDTIKLEGGILYINGKEEFSRHVKSNRIIWRDMRQKVPNDSVFVLGDNRNNSFDSLNFGPLPLEKITGVLTVILWPPSRWGNVDQFKD